MSAMAATVPAGISSVVSAQLQIIDGARHFCESIINQCLAILQRRETGNHRLLMGQTAMQLPGTMMFACATLAGHDSYTNIQYWWTTAPHFSHPRHKMLDVLLERNSIEVSDPRSMNGQDSIKAGMKILIRVIEQLATIDVCAT
ncbi:hypothetical protein EDB19DRAFT_1830623 [Suillus lakei]|nr:hypothetical protein EDB19DRAFT_1830623 [Suillus lakei]